MNFDKELDARGLNCPLPILKAKKALADMVSGETLRVVSTDAGGMIETVKPGITGLMVPRENPTALAAAMLRIIQDPDLAAELADRAMGYVHEHLTADRMVESYIALYETLLRKS